MRDRLQTAGLASINQTEAEGRAPLFGRAMRGCSGIVELLILKKIDDNKRDRYNTLPLFAAVRNKHLEVVKQLLATDQVVLDYEECFREQSDLGIQKKES